MKQTLNNLIDIFKYFADQHLMINDFSFGDLSEIANKEQTAVKYPLLHIQVDRSRIDNRNIWFSFNCLCMDLLHKDKSNNQDVLTDTGIILNDLFNWLDTNSEFKKVFMQVEQNADLIPFSDRFQDEVTGWNLRLTIKVQNTAKCDIPFAFNYLN